MKKNKRNNQGRAMSRTLKRRNFAGKNGIYNIRYHQLNRPNFLAKCVPVSFWCVSAS
ncbi:uncharacterized protein B0T23DRAFT_317739 [Neurospora hispaniola]|uniref:Uncharacterized protein n=1 Tax=Neurospora hispaniola TaxID=588809 RepID=A0AAJ0MR59_9PEZI|nr:hypothetical protein B0T23DRAFT_317739 [Neurospora hispaniola]